MSFDKLAAAFLCGGAAQELAALAHFGLQKGLEYCDRLRTPRHHPQTPLQYGNAGLSGDLFPNGTGAPGASPRGAAFLAAHRNEAKVSHRRAIRLGVAVNDDDAKPASCRGTGARQADDSCADDRQVVRARNCNLRTYGPLICGNT
jgi:hypothetical protein